MISSEASFLSKLLSDQLRSQLFVQALEFLWICHDKIWQWRIALEQKRGYNYLFLLIWLGLEVVSKSLAKNAGLTAGHRVTRQCCKLKNKFRDNSWSCTLQMLPCRCVLKSSAYVDTYQGLLQSSLQEGDHHKCSMPTCTLMMKNQSPETNPPLQAKSANVEPSSKWASFTRGKLVRLQMGETMVSLLSS